MRHVLDDLSAYLDGALAAPERERVAQHLAHCAPCQAERDRLAATLALLTRLPPPPLPSPTFEQRFYARLAAQKAPRPGIGELLGSGWRGAWRWFAPGVAGAAAAAAVMIYAGGRHRADETFLAQHLDLFESYEVVASVGDIDTSEDVSVVAHLQELREGRP